MPENQHTPSWKWNEDGEFVEGKVAGVRRVESRFKEGQLVTVMDVETGIGLRSVWCDAYALRRFIEVEAPEAGDTVALQRVGKRAFTTKSGEERSMWEYECRIERASSGGDFAVDEPEAAPPVADDDIPF